MDHSIDTKINHSKPRLLFLNTNPMPAGERIRLVYDVCFEREWRPHRVMASGTGWKRGEIKGGREGARPEGVEREIGGSQSSPSPSPTESSIHQFTVKVIVTHRSCCWFLVIEPFPLSFQELDRYQRSSSLCNAGYQWEGCGSWDVQGKGPPRRQCCIQMVLFFSFLRSNSWYLDHLLSLKTNGL